jgi:hypothetical protein
VFTITRGACCYDMGDGHEIFVPGRALESWHDARLYIEPTRAATTEQRTSRASVGSQRG